jgi:hypothetical protein
LSDLGLQPDASDRDVWEACQREQVILLTANRNDNGPDSLEATIQQHNTPASLPVFTLANDQRVLRDRLYAAAVWQRFAGEWATSCFHVRCTCKSGGW